MPWLKTMQRCLVRNIRVRWFRLKWFSAIGAAGLLTLAASAITDPVADFKAGIAAIDAHQYAPAIKDFEGLEKRLPKLADYSAWFLATAEFGMKNYAQVPNALEPVWKQTPSSPLAAKAYLLAAEAHQQNGAAKQAVDILRNNYDSLPQPKGDTALAAAFAAAGDGVSAAVYYQRVYYDYPASAEAIQAGSELPNLKALLGESYPPEMASAMLSRALKLLNAGQTQKARKELEALIPRLGGADRDLARVRIGVADYEAKENAAALRYLRSLENLSPEADAERLYYIFQSANRLGNEPEAASAADRLNRQYPASSWRLQALVASGNRLLVDNDFEAYEPVYRHCYESFPKDPPAAFCHWKVTWSHYIRRLPDAGEMMREHLVLFPSSDEAPAALYFLGRLAEGSKDSGSALAFYSEVVREYPNQFYSTQARDRLASLGPGAPAPAATDFLRTISFPRRMRIESFKPSASATARIERAKLLQTAGLENLAQDELRYGAQVEDQPHLMAMELASLYSASHPDQALRYIKHYVSGYLYLPIESAPLQFWTLAFPLPYRSDLERYSKQNGLDPFLVAALIRQESEFDAKVTSYANARGLTQILPSTGRELSRRLKMSYTTAKLFQPAVNLQLGTYYLQSLTQQTGGKLEAALAAYNAGLSRARTWLKWGDFQEPAEFIETVPFSQTRTYVQAVLRNAYLYRQIYGVTQPRAALAEVRH
ncbi:MAG: transglycosylase SLT domain-containing protein [Bryobacterales bacterium]|nr:transglycosylase SLT domain-containing protein [Bryobacterales bacterium]MBV9397939.1 transglycosylase SLT domain-containing protein [Bryobacterales bacterium]